MRQLHSRLLHDLQSFLLALIPYCTARGDDLLYSRRSFVWLLVELGSSLRSEVLQLEDDLAAAVVVAIVSVERRRILRLEALEITPSSSRPDTIRPLDAPSPNSSACRLAICRGQYIQGDRHTSPSSFQVHRAREYETLTYQGTYVDSGECRSAS